MRLSYRTLSIRVSLFFVILSGAIAAQTPAVPNNWFHIHNPDMGFYGLGTLQAYDYVKDRPSKTVIVAVIDSGVDIEHEDLKDNIWTNSKEIPGNGIDDDGNGYVDDVHGWNFIGGKDGSHVNQDNLEATRIVAAWRDEFEGRSEKDFKGNDLTRFRDYVRARAKVEMGFASAMMNYTTYNSIYEGLAKLVSIAETQGIKPVTASNINKIDLNDEPQLRPVRDMAINFLEGESGLHEIVEGLKEAVDYFSSQSQFHYNVNFDPRKEIVGDNYLDSRDRFYGNNSVVGPDASHGTHVAGIIGAVRDNAIGMDGVAANVRIMVLRAVPDGDERDKDVANAIRYAVDNGAQVINMSFGKAFSWDKAAVDEAVRYAEEKGVLLIHAAGNDGTNIDKFPNFPTRFYANGKEAQNWIEVGALNHQSTPNLVAGFSNYGRKSVDLFAPGVFIYSTVPGNDYKHFPGTSMAAPMVAGVAAVIWSYFPDLTAVQVKDVILRSAIRVKGKQIVPESDDEERKKPLMAPLNKLSRTGGLVNLHAALRLADSLYGKK
jgi:subtilisin family serine protease